MKRQVSAKSICSMYRKIFCTGYCNLQTLFPNHTAPHYHAGALYGWNADYFTDDARSILLVTGYRTGAATHGFSREVISLDHDFVLSFEKRALEIVRECGWKKPEEREKRMTSLREEFWQALDKYIKEV